jgi:hypothetical protein
LQHRLLDPGLSGSFILRQVSSLKCPARPSLQGRGDRIQLAGEARVRSSTPEPPRLDRPGVVRGDHGRGVRKQRAQRHSQVVSRAVVVVQRITAIVEWGILGVDIHDSRTSCSGAGFPTSPKQRGPNGRPLGQLRQALARNLIAHVQRGKPTTWRGRVSRPGAGTSPLRHAGVYRRPRSSHYVTGNWRWRFATPRVPAAAHPRRACGRRPALRQVRPRDSAARLLAHHPR